MKQRGRKSAAELSVVASTLTQAPEPPGHLNERQSEIWDLVMNSKIAKLIDVEAYPVLVEYCRSIEKADIIANEINRFNPDGLKDDAGLRRYDKLLNMQDRLTKTIVSAAVKLRITPSTRYQANTAGRLDTTGAGNKKPWDF